MPILDGFHEHDPATKHRLFDARGIYVATVCDECEETKRAQFRPEIFGDADYWHDEPIDVDD